MRRKLVFLCAMLLTFCMNYAWAQQQVTIRGTVTDSENEPVIGATVALKGTTTGVTTDYDGKYTIQATPGQTLQFSFVGMQLQEIVVGNQTTINVSLVDGQELDELVVIGYGTVKKSHLTGAVSSVRADELMTNVSKDVASSLQGKVPGVSVTNVNGKPGQDMSITIRGIASLTNNDPLYVIDGVYGSLGLIDPSDIISIEVLKDAAAAAIYGSRAANGVVLVTTKSGRKASPAKVDANIYLGVQNVSRKLDIMNAQEWMGFLRSHGLESSVNNSLYAQRGSGTDWQDELYQSAIMYHANVAVNGGSENSTYSTSMGYLSQDGIMINSKYERFTARMRSEYSFLNDRLKIGQSLYLRSGKTSGSSDHATIQDALRIPPIVPVYDESRPTGWGAVETWMNNMSNPVGSTYMQANDRNLSIQALFNAYAQVKLYDGLSYKLNFSWDQSRSNNTDFDLAHDFGQGGINLLDDLSESADRYQTWNLENTLNYDKSFGKHDISGLLGYSALHYDSRSISAGRNDLTEGTSVISGGSAELQNTSGSAYASGLVSLFARAMYSYDNRYMLTASIRRDGSSKFEKDYRWGNFPSVSVGWNVHNEAFAEQWAPILNQFKIRASYGTLGNQQIGDYTTKRTLSSPIAYVQGTDWWVGRITGDSWVSPADLTWETTETVNLGVDLSFFNSKLDISADAFIQNTKDILLSVSMPNSAGLSGSPTMNAGTIENRGFEMVITHRNKVGDVFYSISGNMSAIKNNVKEITVGNEQEKGGYNPQGLGTITWFKVGEPMGVFRVIKTDGIFQTAEEIAAHTNSKGQIIQPNAQPGDIRFVDDNDDGQINNDDRVTVGKPIPDVSFGLRGSLEWKGLDLNLFFDGMVGNSIFNFTRYRLENMEKIENFTTDVANVWTTSNKNTDMPRWARDEGDPNGNGRVNSDRWIEKGDFFRLKTLELGYSLPKTTLEKIHIDRLRVFLSADNLFTITGYKGYTPDLGYTGALERGTDHGRYPLARTFSIGVQIGL